MNLADLGILGPKEPREDLHRCTNQCRFVCGCERTEQCLDSILAPQLHILDGEVVCFRCYLDSLDRLSVVSA